MRYAQPLIVSIALLIGAGAASAQRVEVKPQEPARSPAGPAATYNPGSTYSGSGLDAPSLNGTLPTFTAPILAAPAQPAIAASPAPAVAAPPPACRIPTVSDCAAEAGSCLTREAITHSYDVQWDSEGPYVNQTWPYVTDDDDAAATGCATELYVCLQGPCR